jgi:hypothetical protein
MRPFAVGLFILIGAGVPVAAGEKELLDKFKRDNEQGRERMLAQLKEALDKADELEKKAPAKALTLLTETRQRMLEKGLLARREDQALAEPLWERIVALRHSLYTKKRTELRDAVTEYKDYLARMGDQLNRLRTDLVPPTKEPPPGEPAFFALTNGKFAVGWLHERPLFTVRATVNDQENTYGPGVVAGLQVRDGYYLYQPSRNRYRHVLNGEFLVVALYAYPPSQKAGYWFPPQDPPPPPGFDKRSTGAAGVSLFARSAGSLLQTWSSPGGQLPEDGFAPQFGGGRDAARVYRDVLIDLVVQESFPKMPREDLDRCRDMMLAFLDRRPADDPLNANETGRFAESIVEVYPERRGDALRFAQRVNRILQEYRRERKQ